MKLPMWLRSIHLVLRRVLFRDGDVEEADQNKNDE